MSHTLRVKVLADTPNRDEVIDYYQNKVNEIGYKSDCGVNLIFPADIVVEPGRVTKVGLGISCKMTTECRSGRQGWYELSPYDLVPRSSIVKTDLMLANGVGIIDPGYRGEIIAAFRSFSDDGVTLEKGTSLVQIVAPDRKPIKVYVVEELDETERGDKGFGSSTK